MDNNAAQPGIIVKPSPHFFRKLTRDVPFPREAVCNPSTLPFVSQVMAASLAGEQVLPAGAGDACVAVESYAKAFNKPLPVVLTQIESHLSVARGEVVLGKTKVVLMDGTKQKNATGVSLTPAGILALLDLDINAAPANILSRQQKDLMTMAVHVMAQVLTMAKEMISSKADHSDHTIIWNGTVTQLAASSASTWGQARAQLLRMRGNLYKDLFNKTMASIRRERGPGTSTMTALNAEGRTAVNFHTMAMKTAAKKLRNDEPGLSHAAFSKRMPAISHSITTTMLKPALFDVDEPSPAQCRAQLLSPPKPGLGT